MWRRAVQRPRVYRRRLRAVRPGRVCHSQPQRLLILPAQRAVAGAPRSRAYLPSRHAGPRGLCTVPVRQPVVQHVPGAVRARPGLPHVAICCSAAPLTQVQGRGLLPAVRCVPAWHLFQPDRHANVPALRGRCVAPRCRLCADCPCRLGHIDSWRQQCTPCQPGTSQPVRRTCSVPAVAHACRTRASRRVWTATQVCAAALQCATHRPQAPSTRSRDSRSARAALPARTSRLVRLRRSSWLMCSRSQVRRRARPALLARSARRPRSACPAAPVRDSFMRAV